jgi:VIT1/CCC1 family predicted Fe2+/Mn2+ transporter
VSNPEQAATKQDIERYRRNYAAEVDGVALYRLLGEAEKSEPLRRLYERLAETEARHRDLWKERLEAAGAPIPPAKPSFRVRLLGWIARRFGTELVAPVVVQIEAGGVDMYDDQPEAVAAGLPADERSHARLFRQIARSRDGEAAAGQIARLEGRHRMASGNALRAGVLGVNDGLVSMLILVMGVAGADPGRNFVFLSGMTGLLAGAFSMALGEWVSVRSSAEAFERELAVERDEIALNPEEEAEELALIYQAKGLAPAQARLAADQIFRDREAALDTLAREELGMAPGEVGSPWVAALTSFFLFAIGAFLPVAPWIFAGGMTAVAASAILAGVGLFSAGAATSLFSAKPVLLTGGRMLVLGLAGAAVTYGIGAAIGVGVGI